MRARTVNEIKFERGQGPKSTLEIGNKNLRDFRKMVHEKNWFGPMQPIMEGLKEGSIPEAEVVQFIRKAISYYDKRRELQWYDWYYDEGEIYWDEKKQKLIISFEMPKFDFFQIEKFPKLYCELSSGDTFIHGKNYVISAKIKMADFEDGQKVEYQELFQETGLYRPEDDIFKMSSVINLINKVVETTIKNMD